MTTPRGRYSVNRIAAVTWLATQPDLLKLATPDMEYVSVGKGRNQDYRNWQWRRIAEGLKGAGFYSTGTMVSWIPVRQIVNRALALTQQLETTTNTKELVTRGRTQ